MVETHLCLYGAEAVGYWFSCWISTLGKDYTGTFPVVGLLHNEFLSYLVSFVDQHFVLIIYLFIYLILFDLCLLLS